MTSIATPTTAWEPWVRLQLTPGVGPRTARQWVAHTGSAAAAVSCIREGAVQGLPGLEKSLSGQASGDWRQTCDAIADWLASPRPGEQHALWTPDHPDYPTALRDIGSALVPVCARPVSARAHPGRGSGGQPACHPARPGQRA